MAKVAGCDVLVKVSKTDGTYTTIGGQTSATLNRSADTIDVTDKTNNGYKEYMAGLKETVDEMLAKLDEINGVVV